jgi:hypothetical protein
VDVDYSSHDVQKELSGCQNSRMPSGYSQKCAAVGILMEVMNSRFVLSLFLAFLLGAFTLVAAIQEDTDQATMVEQIACLECHGPYDELAEATADYVTPSGESASPHQYVPHEERKVIPKCTECHESHPIPNESMEQVAKPKYIDWCYTRCHHNWDFQPCIACH